MNSGGVPAVSEPGMRVAITGSAMRNELTIKSRDIDTSYASTPHNLGGWLMHTRAGKWTLNIVALVACIALIVWAAPDIKRHCSWGANEVETDGVLHHPGH